MSVKIYGASDDLIEVEGDIREEFNPGDGISAALAFSDGTILDIVYSEEGIWRISPRVRGTAAYSIVQSAGSDTPDYSDVATLEGDIRWVLFAADWRLEKKR